MKRATLVIGIMGLVLGAVACGGQPGTVYVEVVPASITPGSPIPVPSEEVVLSFSGDLQVTNMGNTLQLDMPTLESLGLVEYTVEDPYLHTNVTYTGVLMSEIGKYVGVTQPTDRFSILALDDYQVELTYADVERWPILLATRSNGEYLTIDNSGPTRIVFPYGSYRELDPVKYNDLWIWNIKSMQIN